MRNIVSTRPEAGVSNSQLGENDVVVFVDVDDTLVRSIGSKRIPIPRVVERVRSLYREGHTVYLWSTAGVAYAQSTASELDLAECVAGYLPKPNLIIDDQPVADWRACTYEHPMSL